MSMYNIDNMSCSFRREFLQSVITHLRNNFFFTAGNADGRELESNTIKVTWNSGNGCEYIITSKLTGLTFYMRRAPFITDPFESEFADDIAALYRVRSVWTAMKEKKFNKEFFG